MIAAVAITAAGCQSNTQFMISKQDRAVDTAMKRGAFELNCSTVTPSVLSREVVEPTIEGPRVYSIARAEYTIGVAGCGKRKTFVVLCPDEGDGCFAAGPGRFYGEQ
ncbi:MAG: hypothetical protein WBV93_13765 [Anaerobacillus sp.]